MTLPDSPIVSFVLPTRKRLPLLLRAIQSIADSATLPGGYEIVLRVAYDDCETVCAWEQIMEMAPVRIVIGYPMDGYTSVSFFCDEAARVARGKWIWLFDDHSTFQGTGWEEQLQRLPLSGVIAQPEINKLNASAYKNNADGPFMCVPHCVWRRFGYDEPSHPIDAFLRDLLLNREGWKVHFLKGVTITCKPFSNPPLESFELDSKCIRPLLQCH